MQLIHAENILNQNIYLFKNVKMKENGKTILSDDNILSVSQCFYLKRKTFKIKYDTF